MKVEGERASQIGVDGRGRQSLQFHVFGFLFFFQDAVFRKRVCFEGESADGVWALHAECSNEAAHFSSVHAGGGGVKDNLHVGAALQEAVEVVGKDCGGEVRRCQSVAFSEQSGNERVLCFLRG